MIESNLYKIGVNLTDIPPRLAGEGVEAGIAKLENLARFSIRGAINQLKIDFEIDQPEKLKVTQETINENLNNAIKNGYTDLKTWPVADIASDMMMYCSEFDFEGCSVDTLTPFIEKWLAENK